MGLGENEMKWGVAKVWIWLQVGRKASAIGHGDVCAFSVGDIYPQTGCGGRGTERFRKVRRGIIRGVRVYVEVVLINNLALDALLVYAVLFLRRRKVRKVRFACAAALGAAVAVAYPVVPEWAQILIRALLAPLLTVLFDKYANFKDYIISLALFAGLTFALGGAVSGVSNLIGTDLNGYLILGLTAFAALVMLVAVRCFARARGRIRRKICPARLIVDGREFSADALCDSGNTLTDAVSGLPVVIVSERFAGGIDGWHGAARAASIEGFVELTTVSGRASLPIVKLDGVRVEGREIRAYAALADRDFDGYEVILQNTMF